jgi:hypothetical protein
MRIASLLLLLLAGCPKPAAESPSVAPPTGGPPAPVPPATAPPSTGGGIALPPKPAPVVLRKVCAAPPAAVAKPPMVGKLKRYDFAEITLNSGGHGARVQDRPRPGVARSPAQLRAAIASYGDELRACWIWVRAGAWRPGHSTSVDVALTLDPFGKATAIEVTERVVKPDSVAQEKTPLAACVADMLAGIRVGGITPWIGVARGTLAFELVGLPPRGRAARPKPPAAAAALPASTCVHVQEGAPVHELLVDWPRIEVGEEPPAGQASPWRRRLSYPVSSGRSVCRHDEPDKRLIREALYANLGGYSACYAEALARQPGLRGTLTAEVELGISGEPTHVAVSGDGDAALHECMRAALDVIAVRSTPVSVHNTFTFELDPAPPSPPVAEQPLPELPALPFDAEAIATRLAAAVPAGDGPAACAARVDVLRALASVPWRTDTRVMAAARDFAAFVQNSRADLSACIDDAAPVFWIIAVGDLRVSPDRPDGVDLFRGNGLSEAVDRGRKLIALLPRLQRSSLGLFVAQGLHELDDWDEARIALRDWLTDARHSRAQIEIAMKLAHRIEDADKHSRQAPACGFNP